MTKTKFNIKKFETLSDSNNTMKGGFSMALTTTTKSSLGGNNCHGGTCNVTNTVAGCGSSDKELPAQ
ncbi:hypothetical protein [Flammeovirga sp. EKP202]|uniref:hypothetical protein n=1 Tax=Flammeovirga sp. EKP202 TaxID=2770592 RepID=UPI00165F9082|nr:hypothetical protein [Flammeovirga sp. EKP202]MBD0402557.1 hypothetical protein [Flammeovirga sp. EKP202]